MCSHTYCWRRHCPGRFTPKERAYGAHWIRGWVGPIAGLDAVEQRRRLAPDWNRTSPVQPALPLRLSTSQVEAAVPAPERGATEGSAARPRLCSPSTHRHVRDVKPGSRCAPIHTSCVLRLGLRRSSSANRKLAAAPFSPRTRSPPCFLQWLLASSKDPPRPTLNS
jgi:hypothetical protein